jgi:hypothetical protein
MLSPLRAMISLTLQLTAKKSRSLLLDRLHQYFHFVDCVEHALHFAFVTEKIANAGVDLAFDLGRDIILGFVAHGLKLSKITEGRCERNGP